MKTKCPNSVKFNGFLYEKAREGTGWVIYAQKDPDTGNLVAYEVFCVGTYFRFPKDEDFGNLAWTYHTLEEAEKRAAKLERVAA
jgi:hypothetical protein